MTGYQPDNNIDEDDNIFEPKNIIDKYKWKKIHFIKFCCNFKTFKINGQHIT